MTNFEKENAINYLISKGINFEKDVFELSGSNNSILHDTAKNVGSDRSQIIVVCLAFCMPGFTSICKGII